MSFITWREVNWPLVDSRVLRYQTRIFKASKENNISKVRCLQKQLLNSLDAKLVAVRRVTTLNKGKETAGVDKKIFITDSQKVKLVNKLRLDGKASPIRRVHIPKPAPKTGKRPLGIPTVKDRAKQALCALALEPEWEARFEENSYGFRPGRCCHDAIEAIFLSLRNKDGNPGFHKFVLDADIEKCFDQIDHNYLLQKLETLPEIEKQVKAWLEAGILEGFLEEKEEEKLMKNIMGTPQGGIISPLLSNIALHGMENHLKEWICTKPSFAKTNQYNNNNKRKSIALIRYADDFVIIHKNKEIIAEAKEEIAQWLWNGPRLKLNEDKTSIRNSQQGFNFLGFFIINITRGNKPRLKIYPSKESQEQLLNKVRTIIQRNRNASAYNLIQLLRPIIIGWGNYFKYCECTSTFNKMSHFIIQKLRAWVFRRDTRNGRKEIKRRYFPDGKFYQFGTTKHQDNWILNGKQVGKNSEIEANYLPRLSWIKSEKWIKIKDTSSPFDGNNLYWGKRTLNKGNWSLRQRKLIKIQNGVCPWCQTKF
jgi:RNA-directed DNA polymerase